MRHGSKDIHNNVAQRSRQNDLNRQASKLSTLILRSGAGTTVTMTGSSKLCTFMAEMNSYGLKIPPESAAVKCAANANGSRFFSDFLVLNLL
jgi:hypothetical protein